MKNSQPPKNPPPNLSAVAAKKWRELLPELPDMEPGTLAAFEQFCVAWSRWVAAEGDVAQLRWSRCCRQWAAELKLTPKSRSTRKARGEDSDDPILRLIAGTK